MSNIIHVRFPNHFKYSLKQARKFLGSGYFRKALMEWSLQELERTFNDPQCFTEAYDAYLAIYQFRTKTQPIITHQIGKVIPFKKAA